MGLPMPPGFPLLVVEGIITVLTGVVALSLLFVSPTPRQFFERDPTLSFAYVTQSVPTWMLVVISIIAPLLIIAALHCPIMCRSCRVPNVVTHIVPYSSLAQTLIIANLITNVLKLYVGRLRPNFFALCDYKGYRTAINSGDLSIYFENTAPGALGSLSDCQASPREIHEAQLSFPSGHATTAWAGLGFLALYILATLRPKNRFMKIVRDVAVGVPLALATYISASRGHDYFHNFDDIAVGSLIGAGSAYAVWAFQRSLRGVPTGIPLHYAVQKWKKELEYEGTDDDQSSQELLERSSRSFATAYHHTASVIGSGPDFQPWSICGVWSSGKGQGAMAPSGAVLREGSGGGGGSGLLPV